MLNFLDASMLYRAMKPYLPEKRTVAPLDFVKGIIDNILKANRAEDYIEIVSILTQTSSETITQSPPEEVLGECLWGLEENRIYELINFFEKLGL